MSTILIAFFTVVLILVCAFVILIILMQRASANSGMGSALGGGAMESALGGGASNVLTRGTVLAATLFFVLSFCLYLAHMATSKEEISKQPALPSIESLAPAEEAAAQPSALQGALTSTDESATVPSEAAKTEALENVPAIPEVSTDAEAVQADMPKEAAAVEEATAEAPSSAEVVTSPDEGQVEETAPGEIGQ